MKIQVQYLKTKKNSGQVRLHRRNRDKIFNTFLREDVIDTNETKGCKSKKVFYSRKSAEKECEQAWEVYGNRLFVYHCHLCKKYHLTSKPQQPIGTLS